VDDIIGTPSYSRGYDARALNNELAVLLQKRIPSATRAKGEVYARLGRAEVLDASPDHVHGRVRGTAVYRARVMRDPRSGELDCHCECAAFEEYGPCKHLWALALAAWGGPELRKRASTSPLRDLAATVLEDELRGERAGGAGGAGESAAAQSVDAVRDWKLRLGAYADPDAVPKAAAAAAASAAAGSVRWILEGTRSTLGQGACLYLGVQTPRKRGGFNKLRGMTSRDLGPGGPGDARDQEWLELVLGADDPFFTPFAREPGVVCLRAAQAARLLPEIAQAGRLEVRWAEDEQEAEEAEPQPLAWDAGEPWRFELHLKRERTLVRLRGTLRRGAEELEPSAIEALPAPGLMLRAGTLGRIDTRGSAAVLRALHEKQSLSASAREERALSTWLANEHGAALVELPEAQRAEGIAPHPYLRLDAPKAGDLSIACTLAFAYDGFRVRGGDPRELVWEPGDTRLLPRDRAAEARWLDEFRAAGGELLPQPELDRDARIEIPKLPELVRVLSNQGWLIDAEGTRLRSPGKARFTLSTGIDWLELAGGVEYEGVHATLPALLEAAKSGSGLVRLSDGSLGLLPEKWLSSWGLFAALGEAKGDGLRFRANQALLLEELSREEASIEADARLREAAERVRSFAGLQAVAEPEGFHGELRPYQREGLAWLRALGDLGFGGCLADDMGLGKTVQVLALLAGRRGAKPRRTCLVVAPKSLIFNWQREAERFAPELEVHVHVGTERRRDARGFSKYDLVLTTYGTLRQDIGLLREVPFDSVVLDEAQAIKTAGSQTARAARLLTAGQRLALSGTPVENHLGELWSLMEFLNPGLLGRSRAFASLVESSDGLALADHDRKLLRRALAPLLLRRTKLQVLPELPERAEQELRCELEGAQAQDYQKILDYCRASVLGEVEAKGLERSKIVVLEALLRLRQAACHPGLLDPTRRGESCAKLDLVLPLLHDLAEEGNKALVYSQFTSFLDIVEDRLKASGISYERLDGKTRDREARVKRFQEDPDVRVFLLSLKAGGVGLNLTAASYVFLLDPWWNPAAEAQAIDRAHRIGQHQKVMAYRVVCTGTIEEKVLELQAKKRELFDALFGEGGGPIKSLSKRELEWLLT
jgi:superfamily II DNA or RNA helicase